MRSRKSTDLEAAMAAAQRRALLDHVLAHPSTTIRELLAHAGDHADLAASLTVAEIRGGKVSDNGRRVPATAPEIRGASRSPKAVDTRTKASREKYDGKILAFLKSRGGPVGAEQIRARVGGTGEQARTALKRLQKGRKVKRSGRARATKYVAK